MDITPELSSILLLTSALLSSDDVTTKMPVEEEKETLKEWYNNQKFEALKKLWTK